MADSFKINSSLLNVIEEVSRAQSKANQTNQIMAYGDGV